MDIFKEFNIKKTKQRQEVYIFFKDNTIVYINDLINKLNIDKSTIYRILNLFLKHNIIEKKIDVNENTYYELHEFEHNHYLKCLSCHKKIKIDNSIIQKFEKEINNDNFNITTHNIEFRGICKSCKNKNSLV